MELSPGAGLRKPQVNDCFLRAYLVGLTEYLSANIGTLSSRLHESLEWEAPWAIKTLANGLESRWGHQYLPLFLSVDDLPFQSFHSVEFVL
jgi:hypothetical protein